VSDVDALGGVNLFGGGPAERERCCALPVTFVGDVGAPAIVLCLAGLSGSVAPMAPPSVAWCFMYLSRHCSNFAELMPLFRYAMLPVNIVM
jgi:hypothetical protein